MIIISYVTNFIFDYPNIIQGTLLNYSLCKLGLNNPILLNKIFYEKKNFFFIIDFFSKKAITPNNNPTIFNYKFIGLLNKLYFQNLNSIPTNSITSYKQITEILDETKSFQIERVIGSNIFLRGYIINKESLQAFKEISPFRYNRSLNYLYTQKNNNLPRTFIDIEEEKLLPISSSSSSSSSLLLMNNLSSNEDNSQIYYLKNNFQKINFKIETHLMATLTYKIQDNNTYIITKFKESGIPLKLNIKVENESNFFLTTQRSPNILIRFLQDIKNQNLNDEEAKKFCSNILDLYNHKNNLKFFMYTNLLNVNDDNTLKSNYINDLIFSKINSFFQKELDKDNFNKYKPFWDAILDTNFKEANNLLIKSKDDKKLNRKYLKLIFYIRYKYELDSKL